MRNTLLIAALGLLTGGCLPIPHTTPLTDEVRGRVLNAENHAPVESAKVYVQILPNHKTLTDADGRFHLSATHNFHWGYFYAGERGEMPPAKLSAIGISHPDYQFNGFAWGGPDPFKKRGATDVGDILLKPNPHR